MSSDIPPPASGEEDDRLERAGAELKEDLGHLKQRLKDERRKLETRTFAKDREG